MSKPKSLDLYRYTSISTLLDMLKKGRLFLSDPDSWTDKTDAAFLKKHLENKGSESIKVLCFSQRNETSHYWEIYAKYGCAITFDRQKLLNGLAKKSGFEHGKVIYKEQNKFSLSKYKKDLPFIKQFRYKEEEEYRIIWTGKKDDASIPIHIPIDLNSIKRISISGNIKDEIFDSLKDIIKTFAGNITVIHSMLYENKVWLKKINLNQGVSQ